MAPGWSVVSISGSLPEKVFGDDISQVNPPAGERLVVSEELRLLRRRTRLAPQILIATDPTTIGEIAAHFIATILELEKALRIELLEISPEGLAEAIKRARPIDQKRVAQYRHDKRHSQLIRLALKSSHAEVCGRRDYLPEKSERAVLAYIVERDRQERIEARLRSNTVLLQCDGFLAEPLDLLTQAVVPPGRRVRAQVLSCLTLAAQELAPPPLNMPNLAMVAAARLGLGPVEVHDRVYQLYLRGLVTWPFTTAARLDALGLLGARLIARAKNYPVFDDAALEVPPHTLGGSAIRPVDFAQEICGSPSLQGIYSLIYEHAVLSVLSPSMIKTRRIVMEVDTAQGKLQFEAKGQQAMMHGWRTVAGPRFAQDGREPRPFLPLLNSGDRLFGEIISQHAMAPTNCRRLSEHSFLKDYQPQEFGSVEDTVRALRNLIDAEYVRPERGYLFPTSFGVTVYQLYAQPHQTLPVRQHQSPPRGPLHLVDN